MTPAQFADQLSASARALTVALRKDIATAALRAEARAKRNATTILRVRSGRLRASIRSLVEPGKDGGLDLKLSAGGGREGGSTEVVYARIHELGGTIRPVKRKFLAIPLPIARTPAGVSRYKTPRDVPDLHVAQSKRGNLLLVKPDGTPWYVLRKRVDIPARPYLRPALEEASAALVPRLADTLTATLALNVPT